MQKLRTSISILSAIILLNSCNSALQSFKKGQKKFDNGEYELAIKELQKASGAGYELGKTNYLIAESYRLSNRPLQAGDYYEKALASNSRENDLRYHLAMTQKMQGKYKEAGENLEKYLSGIPSKELKNKAQTEIDLLPEVEELANKKTYIEVKPLSLNSTGTEFAPIPQGNELIFTASRKDIIYKNNGLPYLGLYRATLNSPTEIGTPSLFSSTIFKDNANEGTPTFSKDGKMMVFARGNTGKRSDASPDVDLYISKNIDGVWSEPEMVSVSDSLAWDGCPSFSADNKTLYFGSNRAGGKGGIDIYRANIDNAGRFGRAINMGSDINTAGDEMFPYVSKDGKLYFSSDGHAGIGGLDLYSATRINGEIKVEHLGIPLNSRFDDFGLVAIDSTKGYFASNRDSGKGDDDIYYYENTQPGKKYENVPPVVAKKDEPKKKTIRYFLAGNVTDINNQALDSVKVAILDNSTNQAIDEVYTKGEGTFGKVKMEEEKTYTIVTEKKGYFTKREPFTMVGKSISLDKLTKAETDTIFYASIKMEKPEVGKDITKTFNIAPIYYNLDKSEIRNDAANELDRIVQVLVDNPTIKLELGSHTDSRATAEYNQKLSQRRADSAVAYIISKGISSARIVAKGYGESQLVNKCADGVPCSEEEHQANRRTEFKVLEVK
ncbi:WD40 repeat protein [Arcicella aurantiaca]|uniref:WD40 repeat protein n=1 Tax=Arcicella aurantiaca TaxID=591202 RepID=A0A316EJH5_9BACT|nr:OmpA family protein [Arcicella aurantiaca]PWK28999.1 WD40 repeat protein [Arcicella aurantiaca]